MSDNAKLRLEYVLAVIGAAALILCIYASLLTTNGAYLHPFLQAFGTDFSKDELSSEPGQGWAILPSIICFGIGIVLIREYGR